MTDPYFNRFDPSKNYDEHRFVPGRPLQSAELNEIQSVASSSLRGVADAILRDGNVIRDAGIIVNPDTGVTTCEAGAIYLRGKVRGVPPATITVPIVGTVAVGIRLQDVVVTSAEDPDLLDPATGTRGYNQAGANRLQVNPVWSWSGDGLPGEFSPVYSVTDGIQNAKAPPPQLDSITQALARYDRDSAGGNYVVSGLYVTRAADRVDGYQVYSVEAGRAYVNGIGLTASTSRRLPYNAVPVTRFIDSEPMASAAVSAQRVNVARAPIASITQVRITAQKTVTLVHGTVTGAQDPLPDPAVVSIVSVVQGGTTYIQGTDYQLTAGKVDWSLPGSEVAPGSSYNVTYQYITAVTPTAVDDTGFTITGAVVGSLIQTSYYAKLPRVDRLCLDINGEFVWIEGASTDYDPVRPNVPSTMLPLAQVVQYWNASTYVINDGVRVLPMQELEEMSNRLDLIIQLVSEQKLRADVGEREASAKKGVFVDPFLSDENRDQGITQTAAVVRGELILGIQATVLTPSNDVAAPTTCAKTAIVALEQTQRTGFMKINPYMSFAPLPSKCTLTPAIDTWTEFSEVWLSPVTERFTIGDPGGNRSEETSRTVVNRTVNQNRRSLQFMRQIPVRFRIEGFGGGEILQSITFDGLNVTITPD